MKKLAIIGSGCLARRIAYLASQTNQYEVVGYIDNMVDNKLEYPILGDDDDVETLFKRKKIDCLSIGLGYLHFNRRQEIFDRFHNQVPFARIIHPSCIIDDNCKIGEGCVIFAASTLVMLSELKDNVMIGTNTLISHETVIDSHTYIAGGCNVAGKVYIGKRCFIGIGATIIDGKTICDDVIIGAGATVIANIYNRGTYVGVPAHKIK